MYSETSPRPKLRNNAERNRRIALAVVGSVLVHAGAGTFFERQSTSKNEHFDQDHPVETQEHREIEQALHREFQEAVYFFYDHYVDTTSPDYEGAETGYVVTPPAAFYTLDAMDQTIKSVESNKYATIDLKAVRAERDASIQQASVDLIETIETLVQQPEYTWTNDYALNLPQAQDILFTSAQALFEKKYYKGNGTISRQVSTRIINCTVARMTPIVLGIAGVDLKNYRAVRSEQHISTGVVEDGVENAVVVFEEQVLGRNPFYKNTNFNDEPVTPYPLSHHFIEYLKYYYDLLTPEQQAWIPVTLDEIDKDIPDEILSLDPASHQDQEGEKLPSPRLASLYSQEATQFNLNSGQAFQWFDETSKPTWFKNEKIFKAILERAIASPTNQELFNNPTTASAHLTAIELFANPDQKQQYETLMNEAAELYSQTVLAQPNPERVLTAILTNNGFDPIQLELLVRAADTKDPAKTEQVNQIIKCWQKVGEELVRQYHEYTTVVRDHSKPISRSAITTPQVFAEYLKTYQRASQTVSEALPKLAIKPFNLEKLLHQPIFEPDTLPVTLLSKQPSAQELDATFANYDRELSNSSYTELVYSDKVELFLKALQANPKKMDHFLQKVLPVYGGSFTDEQSMMIARALEYQVVHATSYRQSYIDLLKSNPRNLFLHDWAILLKSCPSLAPDLSTIVRANAKDLQDYPLSPYLLGIDQPNLTEKKIEDLSVQDITQLVNQREPGIRIAPDLLDPRFTQQVNHLYQTLPTATERINLLVTLAGFYSDQPFIPENKLVPEDKIILTQTTPDMHTVIGLQTQLLRFMYHLVELPDNELVEFIKQLQAQPSITYLDITNGAIDSYWKRHATDIYKTSLKDQRPGQWKKELVSKIEHAPTNIFIEGD